MKYHLLRNERNEVVTNLAWDISQSLFVKRFNIHFTSIFIVPGTDYKCPFEEKLYENLLIQLWVEDMNQPRIFFCIEETLNK